jgi:hypothetical protein
VSVQEPLGKVLADEHTDVLRQAVVWLAQQLMEAEVTAGAGYGERSGDRVARRNGCRQRDWAPEWGRSSWPSHGCISNISTKLHVPPGAGHHARS